MRIKKQLIPNRKNMKKLIFFSALTFFSVQLSAQMTDISVTLQPTGSYNWFDKNTNIDNGLMYGGRLGFGFGESIEIRALYEKSADIKNTVKNLNFANEEFLENFKSRDVNIERMGGEFKANIPTRGTFVPYVTLGAGVQKLKVNIAEEGLPAIDRKSEQIYANLGLGTQIKLGERVFLNLEAKNTVFNMDPADVLYREGPNTGVGNWLNDKTGRMYNWSALAGLQFYLGGREPGTMSALDRAYYNKFSGGMGGLKLILEPGGSYIKFNDNSNLKDTYLLGGKAGFDLNQFIGLRGFYYRATKDEKISTKWDNLAIYGGDITAKLNVARGVVPFIELGGGYMNVYDSYEGANPLLPVQQSGYFAKGGVGLAIPVSKNFELFGSANLMYTAQRADNDLQNIISPSELTKHTMYNAGLRFKLGSSTSTDDILESRIDSRVQQRTDIYEGRINQLEKELQLAYKENDTEKVVEIIEEKKSIEDKKMKAATSTIEKDESRIRMTPAELEKLVEKVIQGVDDEKNQPATNEERIDRLERLLLEVNMGGARDGIMSPVQQDLASDRIINKLDQLNAKIDNNTTNINRMSGNQSEDKTVVITQGGGTQPQPIISPNLNQGNMRNTDNFGNTTNQQSRGVATGFFIREGMSLFTGYAFGDGSAGLVGIRGHYSISTSPVSFMPDLYIATGSKSGFGLNANALVSLGSLGDNSILNPYLGLGLGYNKVSNHKKFGTNLVLGTSFNVLGGNLYADYTARGFINMHQVSVGYKFGF